MKLIVEPYLAQAALWPERGRHLLAQYDDESVVVYQAYKPSIGDFAARNGFLGGEFAGDLRSPRTTAPPHSPSANAEFSLGRMSWVKPGFLWMMFRSGWGRKENQETTLAVRVKREAFEAILAQAVASTAGAVPGIFADESAWKAAVATSNVRLQWDPDHHPSGAPLERRAIQLGLRGETLRRYAREWLLGIEDISDFVREQRAHVEARALDRLVTPREREYVVRDPAAAARLGLS